MVEQETLEMLQRTLRRYVAEGRLSEAEADQALDLDAEELTKALEREDLAFYGEHVHRDDFGRPLRPARHHELWIRALQDESEKKLLLIAPPGHAKTTWVSVVFPAWYLGRDRNRSVILASVTATQANLRSVAVRDTIWQNERYHTAFPAVAPDFNKGWAEGEWFVQRDDPSQQEATFAAAGVGGPVIGRRADLIILDDPHDEENSATELQRNKVKTWFKRTLRSRLRPGGRMIVILTRWHNDDLAKELKQDGYKVIHLPAIAVEDDPLGRAPGEALWPEVYPIEVLNEIKSQMGTALFNCMYQGDPSGLEGTIFKQKWFRYFDEQGDNYILFPPDGAPRAVPKAAVRKVQICDVAVSTDKQADYFVDTTFGVAPENDILVLDVARDRLEGPDQPKLIKSQYAKHAPVSQIGIEQVAYQLSLIQTMIRETSLPVIGVKPDKDKVSRALPVAARYEQGKVYHRRGASWLETWEAEFREFPKGRHDDQVDTASGLFTLVNSASGWLDFARQEAERLKAEREAAAKAAGQR